jgi:hypothetical protein
MSNAAEATSHTITNPLASGTYRLTSGEKVELGGLVPACFYTGVVRPEKIDHYRVLGVNEYGDHAWHSRPASDLAGAVPLLYCVEEWETDPSNDEDDCNIGYCYATEAEARRDFIRENSVWLRLVGPNGLDERLSPIRSAQALEQERREDDLRSRAQWAEEIAMEAGMVHGVDAYNDIKGW